MIKDLVKLANHLDEKGLKREADFLDSLIQKWAKEDRAVVRNYQFGKNDTMFDVWSMHTKPGTSKTLADNLALNGMTEEDAKRIQPCQMVKIWTVPEYEGGAMNPECMGR